MQETAAVLNIVLHAIYNLSCAMFAPSLDDVLAAVNALKTYGVSLQECFAADSALRTLVLTHAVRHPIEIYAMAGAHALESIAVTVSSHLLSYDIPSLPDALALHMGAIYLRRLGLLQAGRIDLLRNLVLGALNTHVETKTCKFNQQKDLTSAWALAVAELAWQVQPGTCAVRIGEMSAADILRADLLIAVLQNALGGIEDQFQCSLCKDTSKTRLKFILYQWTLAEVCLILLSFWDARSHAACHVSRERSECSTSRTICPNVPLCCITIVLCFLRYVCVSLVPYFRRQALVKNVLASLICPYLGHFRVLHLQCFTLKCLTGSRTCVAVI